MSKNRNGRIPATGVQGRWGNPGGGPGSSALVLFFSLDKKRPRQWTLLFAGQTAEGFFGRSALQRFHYCGTGRPWKVCYKREVSTDRFTCLVFEVLKGKLSFFPGHRFPDLLNFLFFPGTAQKNKINPQNFLRALRVSDKITFSTQRYSVPHRDRAETTSFPDFSPCLCGSEGTCGGFGFLLGALRMEIQGGWNLLDDEELPRRLVGGGFHHEIIKAVGEGAAAVVHQGKRDDEGPRMDGPQDDFLDPPA